MKVSVFPFATFIAANPSTKIATVAAAKNPTAYDPKIDWWKQLREFIPRNHQVGGSQRDLVKFAASVTERKRGSYSDRVANYNAWWGKHQIASARGSSASWSAAGLDVTVNPELFLTVDGDRYVIKVYFKGSEKLSADRANVVLRLMELSYRKGSSPAGAPIVGILDLAQGSFVVPSTSLAYLDPLLAGEAASFATIWPSV